MNLDGRNYKKEMHHEECRGILIKADRSHTAAEYEGGAFLNEKIMSNKFEPEKLLQKATFEIPDQLS